jgi:O-antigen/teichoic acid export membrane protein
MADSSLKQKTAKGLFWGGFSSGVQQLLSLGFGIAMARILNSGDYGLVAELSIISGIATAIVNCGFPTALTNKRDATHDDFNAVFWFSTLTGLMLYAILFFCAPLIAAFYGQPELTALARVVFLCLPAGSFSVASHTVLYKQMLTRRMALIETVSLLTACLIGLAMALSGMNYWAIAIQTLIFVTVGSALKFIFAPWKPTFAFRFAPLKPMFAFGSRILLTGIFAQISYNIFAVVIGKRSGENEAGNYSQGQKWAVMGCSFIGSIVSYVTQPVLAQISHDRNRQVNVLRKLIRFGSFISFPTLLGLAFTGREFIVIAVGEKWLPSVPYLQLFCLWASTQFLVTLYSNLIFSQQRSSAYMRIHVLTGLVQLAVIALLSPFGVLTMVSGYVAVSFLSLAAWHRSANRLIGIRATDVAKDVLPYPAIALLCFAATWLLTVRIDNLYALFAAKIIISAMLYVAALRTLKSIIFIETAGYLSQAAANLFGKIKS